MGEKNKRKLVCALSILLIISFTLVAQGHQEKIADPYVRTATDALGREVTVPVPIERIMVVGRAAVMPADALFMFPSLDEIEILLAKTDQGLGDFFSLLRPEFALEPRLGQKIGAEEIIAYHPTLILTKSSNYDSIGTQLEPFNIPVFVMDLETPQAWKDEVVQLGKLLGDEETPKRIIREFEKREAAVDSRISTLDEHDKPSVVMMQAADSDGVTSFSVAPKTWIQTTLVERAGGKPVWLDAKLATNSWRKVSFEQIAAWDPANIVVISYKTPATQFITKIKESPQWQQLQAIRQNNLVSGPADVMNYIQSDSRWIMALEWLAAELHPQLFKDFNMEKVIRSFYNDFYGITDESILTTLVAAYRATLGI